MISPPSTGCRLSVSHSLFVGFPGLRRIGSRYPELADVVEEGGPSQPLLVRLAEVHWTARRSTNARTRSQWPRVIRSCRLKAAR